MIVSPDPGGTARWYRRSPDRVAGLLFELAEDEPLVLPEGIPEGHLL
jgi:hypothetical protein